MRVFVTGANGHIGSLVTANLLAAGHQVIGLARSDTSAAALTMAGAEVHRGSLDDPDGLRVAAAAADGVIHLAYKHDFTDFATGLVAAGAADLAAVEAMGEVLAGSDKPLVVTSGTLMIPQVFGQGHQGVESDVVTDAGDPPMPRLASEVAALRLADAGVRSSVIRLAPLVHGPTDVHGFLSALIAFARESGAAAYLGDGANRWPAVHDVDAADLYRLALEKAPAGSMLHGIGSGDEGVPFRDIAATIGRHLDLPARSVGPDEAARHLGFLAAFAGVDNPTSSAMTRELLGWEPVRPGLVEDLSNGHYFRAERTRR